MDNEEEWTCTNCGGPMYHQSHWKYAECDDCGKRENMEQQDE